MFRIKRIYTFILQTFMPVFCMTLTICLFILLMQFLWSKVDELVGKGLGVGVMAELFFYAALQMIPMALPLAVLLASLMTFGNLGESLELLAMRASGISLIRIMRPLIIFIVLLTVANFYFQDHILPKANTKMYSLFWGIKNKSPELEIPEGVFYKELDGYNIYVGKKDFKTGLLKDITIYIFDGTNIEDATVTVADSARIQMVPDGKHLKLALWNGEQVGTFKEGRRTSTYNQKHPKYRRESFDYKEVYIPYNNNLERTDESVVSNRHVGKNLRELQQSVDSLDQRIDSINLGYGRQLSERTYFRAIPEKFRNDSAYFARTTGASDAHFDPLTKEGKTWMTQNQSNDSIRNVLQANTALTMPVNLDSVYASLRPQQMEEILRKAQSKSQAVIQTFDIRTDMQAIEYKNRSYHEIEIHKKFALSFGCLLFFFIGAPLGAIIRKGGMGVPVIVSVLFFIVYYIIDNTGYKSARDGEMSAWAGIWLSAMVLAPIGIFLTWRALNDSTLFDWDTYLIQFRKGYKWVKQFLRRLLPFLFRRKQPKQPLTES